MRRRYSRKDFLKAGSAGLAGAVLFTGCGGSSSGDGAVIYGEGPDDTGTLSQVFSAFNEEFEGRYSVEYREMPATSEQHFDVLRTQFQAGGGEIDTIGGDVVWPAQLASNGWLLDLSDRFTDEMQADFIDGNVRSNVYDGEIYGVPCVTGAGLLYYRSDLLEESGFSNPPTTWDELKEQALKVMQDSGTKLGMVFQGANYEGGVCNGMEHIWTNGGDILDGDDVVIDSPEAAGGLAMYRSLISDGVTTDAVSTYKEDESQAAFLRGEAVFHRNWSYVYSLLSDESQSSITPDQVGIAPLPAAEGVESSSALGARNLYINATSNDPEASWELIRYITSPEQQRMRAIEGSILPVLKESYEDQELLDEVPVMALGKDALTRARPRPVSPFYSDMSLEMAERFSAVLKGEMEAQRAVSELQTELERIVEEGRNL